VSAQHLLLVSLAVLFAAFVQGATGVGFALIAAPVIGLVRPDLLPVCVLVLMLPLNLYVMWRERGAIDRTGARWITGGRVLGTAGGLWVLAALSASQLSLFVGASTVAAALVTLAMPAFSPGRSAFVAAGRRCRWRWSTSTSRRPPCARPSRCASWSASWCRWPC
jgi:uncharacterized membrane protein YfcA